MCIVRIPLISALVCDKLPLTHLYSAQKRNFLYVGLNDIIQWIFKFFKRIFCNVGVNFGGV